MKRFLILLCILSLSLLSAGCGEKKLHLTFIVDGKVLGTNGYASVPGSLPSAKPPEHYAFRGWVTNENQEVTPAWLSENFAEGALTLYAAWEPLAYKVSFEVGGGDALPDMDVPYGLELGLPIPQRAGKAFDGWFTDEGLTKPFTLTHMPGQPLKLYAKWG